MYARLRQVLAGRYRLEREVGRGGMAIVFQARDLKHDRWVALKVLRPELGSALGPERFLREISLAAGLAHPNILALYDSGDADGLLYYVMPFVEGESLRHRLVRDGRIPLDEAVAIAREVADALDHAHRANIVHRDVKPENILLQAGHAVVSDFGIARAISAAGGSRVTSAGIAVGTPEYMSPEQAAGDEMLDGRSDVYSLGIVLFEMLVGQTPFGGTTPQKVLARKLRETQPDLAALGPVSEAAAAAVGRALAQRPGDRFATAAEFGRALTVGGRPSPRWVSRRIAIAVAAVLLLAGAAGAWWWSRGPGAAGPATLDPNHLAVLYFDDLSGGHTLAPIARGLTEDLIDQLVQVPVLHVTSSAGVAPFRGHAVPPDSIARALGVGTLVAGSVARSGDQLRVSVRLIDAGSGQQLHSHTFQHPWGEFFTLQDSLTEDIANFLRERLGEAIELRRRRAETRSVEAWALVPRAEALLEDGVSLVEREDYTAGTRALAQADSLLVQAIAADPAWPEPLIVRGLLARSRGIVALSVRGSRAAFADWCRQGLRYAEAALRLRPGDPRALALRGTLRSDLWTRVPGTSRDTLVAAERDLRAAVTADPGLARAWDALSDLYVSTGRFAEADQAARRALEADAYLRDARSVIDRQYFTTLLQERFDDARYWCRLGVRRFPDDPDFTTCGLRLLGWSGSGKRAVDSAWAALRAVRAHDAGAPTVLDQVDRYLMVAAVVARSGMRDSARAVLRLARAAARDSMPVEMAMEEAWVRVLLGETDDALALLARSLAAYPQARDLLAQNPWFRPLRNDPRFTALITARP